MKKVMVALGIALLLCGCGAGGEERIAQLEEALIEAGYAKQFVPVDAQFLKDIEWAEHGVNSKCLTILELHDSEKLKQVSESGFLAAREAEAFLIKERDGPAAVNGDFVLVRARQSGEICASVYEKYESMWDSPEAEAKEAEIVKFFRDID